MTSMTSLLGLGACCFTLLALGCGDDKGDGDRAPDDNSGGASDEPAPALVRDDCASKTSELRLSQPEGANVWGGLVLAEFDVEGGKTRNFDIQVFDPSLQAWINSYADYNGIGQREDGTYFIAVRPTYNESNKNEELRLRIRPWQEGCPNGEWTESEPFVAGDPVASTSWTAEVPGTLLSGSIDVQRTSVPGGEVQPPVRVELASAKLRVELGKKGAISETVTAELRAEEGAPFDGCTLSLTFSGSYELLMRSYGGITLAISEQTLTSTEGTSCTLPSVEELALSDEAFDLPLSAFSQSVNIDYQPTLWADPAAPFWQSAFLHVFEVLPQYLGYTTDTETGVSSGYVSPQELTLLKD
jgi:hypothetical protein